MTVIFLCMLPLPKVMLVFTWNVCTRQYSKYILSDVLIFAYQIFFTNNGAVIFLFYKRIWHIGFISFNDCWEIVLSWGFVTIFFSCTILYQFAALFVFVILSCSKGRLFFCFIKYLHNHFMVCLIDLLNMLDINDVKYIFFLLSV
jgi:hypothetical protein